MSEEKELKLQYWRMAVLCAMEWVNSSSGQPYSDKPIAPARLEKLIVSWGVTADRSTLEVIMGDLKLLHFEEKSSAYAALRPHSTSRQKIHNSSIFTTFSGCTAVRLRVVSMIHR